jgi:ThiF family
MSGSRLVRNSVDLARLVQDGYSVRIVGGFLVIDDVPFVDDAAQVQWGVFLCPLDLNGDATSKPSTHVMCFIGGVPRDKTGRPIDGLVNDGVEKWSAGPAMTAACGFSQKPRDTGYTDFYEKVTYYAAMIMGPAQAIDPQATPLQFKPVETDEDDGVFRYLDTFSSRAGITELNSVLALTKVVIVGLGGTGSYLLDLLAKTPVLTLDLYDGDIFRSHNAFRAPGAADIEDLRTGMPKVRYYEAVYSLMRRGIRAHQDYLTAANVAEILDADFVFLAMDTGVDKKVIIEALTSHGIPYIDTGIGLGKDPDGINGQIRVTTSTPGRTDHIGRDKLISFFVGQDAEYDTNLQVAELNALAATLAVIRYKKILGFYADAENERHTVYAVDSNELFNRYGSDQSAAAAEEASHGEAPTPEPTVVAGTVNGADADEDAA